mmetsp:Transcript_55706/g.166908  ORF Transcript_55706/g.166908 Transcript_55706/m.166908 type:complete len:355 (-) Transcript_55706:118-1182(-)
MTYVTFDSLRAAALRSRPSDTGRISEADESSPSPRRVSDQPPPQAATSPLPPPPSPRDEVIRLGAHVGRLCSAVLTHAPSDPPRNALGPEMVETESFPPTMADVGFWAEKSKGRDEIASAVGMILLTIFVLEQACGMDLRVCILKKIELNGRKYPVKLCKVRRRTHVIVWMVEFIHVVSSIVPHSPSFISAQGKSGKYTAYSDQTGITKTDGQSTLHTDPDESLHSTPSSSDSDSEASSVEANDLPGADTIEGITLRIRRFATDRSWCRYHTPRNIVLALLGELGELAELFQWKGDGPDGAPGGLQNWLDADRDTVGQELADVSIYLLRLADVCGVDVGREAMKVAAEHLTRRG